MFSLNVMNCGENAGFLGQIILGDHVESFPIIVNRWSIEEYNRQWFEAAQALVSGVVAKCMFITDIQPPMESSSISYWAAFYDVGGYVFQERFMRRVPDADLFDPVMLELFVPPRVQHLSEEQELISEWMVSRQDMMDFLRKSNEKSKKSGSKKWKKSGSGL